MRKFLTVLIFLLVIVVPFTMRGAVLNHDNYPKLANLFYRWHIEDAEIEALSRWDILIIDMDVQTYTPQALVKLKQLNPEIKLLVYLAPQEIRGDSGSLNGTLRQKLYNRVSPSWWLKTATGDNVAWWAPNPLINITRHAQAVNDLRWPQALANFVNEDLMGSGYWDGVFYDNAWDDISFLGAFNIDANGDGQADSITELNQKWREGMTDIFQQTRLVLGADKIIMGNGGEAYFNYLNGSLYESFPSRGWTETMKKYRLITEKGYQPAIGIINTTVNNTGKRDNYALMRFGLTSALLANGYSGFDNGDMSHNEVWWYDEYEVNLGQPIGSAINLLNSKSSNFSTGLWRRDFTGGVVLVNSDNQARTVSLGAEYEKIHGSQDLRVNDGSFVSEVTVPAQDGLILLRPLDKIYNTTFSNGSFARVFNRYGNVLRAGFFTYSDLARGGQPTAEIDLDADGKKEIISAGMGEVKVFSADGVLQTSFYPYTDKYKKDINFDIGDINGDGQLEIVTGTGSGGGPQVRIFSVTGKLVHAGFFAYDKNFRGGVKVALGDVDANGSLEIITGAGLGGGPQIRIFSATGQVINNGFFAFDKKFRGGVNVAVGDINGDGFAEIIAGPGRGAAPQVKVFDKFGKLLLPVFFAFDSASRDGVEVAATDFDGDGLADIIATSSAVFTLMGL